MHALVQEKIIPKPLPVTHKDGDSVPAQHAAVCTRVCVRLALYRLVFLLQRNKILPLCSEQRDSFTLLQQFKLW